MHKKSFAIVLAAMLVLAGCAGAEAPETKMTTIMLEGMEEEIELTRFSSGKGYEIWYDASILMPPTEENTETDQFVTDAALMEGIQLTISRREDTPEEVLALEREALQAEEYSAIPMETEEGFLSPLPVLALSGLRADDVAECYVVGMEGASYVILMTYPMEAAEGAGMRLYEMVKTFAALPQE